MNGMEKEEKRVNKCGVVGGVLRAARVPADPWSITYKYLDLHCIVAFNSRGLGSEALCET